MAAKPQVAVGKPEGIAGVDVGQPTLQPPPTVSVGQPQLQRPLIDADGNMDFAEFYAACQGNPMLAESFIPGITSPQGAALLKRGAHGKPQVTVKNPVAQQRLYEKHHEHKKLTTPEYLPYSKLPKGALNDPELYPDAATPSFGGLGLKAYLQRDEAGNLMYDPQSGDAMVRNPAHPNTKQKAIAERQHRADMEAKAKQSSDERWAKEHPAVATDEENP